MVSSVPPPQEAVRVEANLILFSALILILS